MFAAIYQIYLKRGQEKEYLQSWKIVSRYFTQNCGAIHSTIHQVEDGSWLIYSKWPNKKKKEKFWPQEKEKFEAVFLKFPKEIQLAIQTMQECKIPDMQKHVLHAKVIDFCVKNKDTKNLYC